MIWNRRGNAMSGQIAEFEELFPAIRLAKSSRWARRLATWLAFLLLVIVLFTAFAPWQQFVGGRGRVVAFDPLLREQIVQAPIAGRVASWADGIREGAQVKEGDRVVEIRDLAPDLLDRLQDQVTAMETQLEAERKVVFHNEKQVAAFFTVREQAVAAADEYIMMAQQKLRAEEHNLDAAEAALQQTEADSDRQETLANKGIASEYKQQVALRKKNEAIAKVKQANAYIASAKNGVNAKINERSSKESEAQAKIDYAISMLRKAEGGVAKIEKDLVALNVKLTQQQSQIVTAPRDGVIFKLETFQQGAIVKKGDSLFTLVPDTANRAVEIWLDGNDASWVTTGRHVRLQFEGWPGIQLAGWPSVAVNTFGGRVAVVDSTDNGEGQFRILVQPDPDDKPWPSDRYLRQGVRANGLVVLERVPLWFEVWRQLNGFPPVVDAKQTKAKSGGGVLKKLK